MSVTDEAISFAANVVGVLLGAFMGYLLGLRQQRKIDNERDDKRRKELGESLKAELQYISAEVTRKSFDSSDVFGPVAFDFIFLDLPTFTSIVNSGQLVLLDSNIVRALRELNTEVHEHNITQAIFAGVGGTLNPTGQGATSEELRMLLENPSQESKSRLGGLLKVVINKRKSIAQKADELIRDLS